MNDVKGKMQALKTSQTSDEKKINKVLSERTLDRCGIIRMWGFFVSGTCDYRNVVYCQWLEWRHGAIVDVA